MRIHAVQSDIVWEDKPANFARVRALLDAAKPERGSLVLLTEMFATGFSMNTADIAERPGGPTEQFLAVTAKELGVCLLAGAAMRGSDDLVRNKALVFGPGGELLAYYAKLQPFAPGGEARHYTAGERVVTFEWQGITVAPFVCYDLRFPEVFRRAALAKQPQLMTLIASWPEARTGHFVKLLQARAIENQCYVAGVNRIGSDPQFRYTGQSFIADFHGNIIADAADRECVFSAELDLQTLEDYRRALPFLGDIRRDFVS